ncbi:MAG: Bifunctional protein FolD protein [Candidatus Omnitrophica bacterium ADurb.Bin292]|jgi:methylenetetrahydrofolate dehydrogenase (NADP+)/methenyltetrahydrofolate cyclohydrolase|nr:MAG: Bifunctional protein FolD protein [Candidatus Omnitrophica bacterium ADurb.Bin292]HPW76469.1 bifunctional 5,10-methylenetetrahydrofolate dehydrogenase/5,10-methenyltetrahydrofolate cyclohydrolase [Candidatus Omnitrophota bacterium]HQB11377.1 bifunctional 5,10-methylenetetrahydrofolate dehydrogenase/5,10-methenyltetrahydrofolate cyclohydrolase [Candidatus Omnitrophota bacterium]
MESKRLEGKLIAAEIQTRIEKTVREILTRGDSRPRLVSIQTSEDPSAVWYVGQQEKLAAKLGIDFQRISPQEVLTEKALIEKVQSLSADPKVHGLFISMPLPEGFDADKVLLAMDSRKDVEGIHPASLGLIMLRKGKLIPPTAYAAFSLIKSTEIMLRGKKAVIIGQSAIVGRPLQLLLGEARVTTLVCNTGTSEEDIKKLVGMADIVIGCAGKPGMIKGEWIKKGAVVIDVGTTEVEGKLVGDIEFEAASLKAAFITPVPGGVGPLTVTMLMKNLITAYEWQNK